MIRPVTFKLSCCYVFNFLALFLLCFSHGIFAQPLVVKEYDVRDCQYLDQIEGESGYGKNLNWQILAKYAALGKAEKLAATHVVWMQFNPVGGFNGVAVAKAYRCNQGG